MMIWFIVGVISISILALLGVLFTVLCGFILFRRLLEIAEKDDSFTAVHPRSDRIENDEPEEERNEYGVKFPSRFQLGETVAVHGMRVRVVGVSFALLDMKDGLGQHPKVLYTIEHPTGRREEIYSNEASPTLRAVK